MLGARLILKTLAYGTNNYVPIIPGEPVFDPASKRFGIGIGGYNVVWYPKATPTGDMQFDEGQGLVNQDGSYALRFKQNGIAWNVGGQTVLETLGSNGIAVQQAIMMRNAAGADVVIMGYGHYVAFMTMLFKLKALLRKIVAGTATTGDVNALFTPDPNINLAGLDPAFPEGPAL